MLWEEILVGGLCVKFCVKFSAGCMEIVTLGGNWVWGVMFCISAG